MPTTSTAKKTTTSGSASTAGRTSSTSARTDSTGTRTTTARSTTARSAAGRTSSAVSAVSAAARKPRVTTSTDELAAVKVRELLDDPCRHYRFDSEVGESYEMNYKYLHHDVKLLRLAEGSAGVESDCFVLYIIALMGAADRESIFKGLVALKRVERSLAIPSISDTIEDKRTALHRLDVLVNSGFVYRHHYQVPVVEKGSDAIADVTLYSITPDGMQLMNMCLQKRIISTEWFQAKPLDELVGWGSAAYVGTHLALQKGFHSYEQGIFRTRSIGTLKISAIIKVEADRLEDHPAYVGVIPAFLHHEVLRQTDSDYKKSCYGFVNKISQFLYYEDMRGRYARVVVPVESNDDLVSAASWIGLAGTVDDKLDRIFFTGEGVIRKTGKLDGSFLSMRKDSKAKGGFVIVPAHPDFVRAQD